MAKPVYSVITRLFAHQEHPGTTRDFAWRLIQRRRRPFLLLPLSTMSTRVSLTLYSAQRRRAKIWRAFLPVVLNSPAAMYFQRISLSVSQSSEILRFLSEQSGVPIDRLPAPAIKFGGKGDEKSRLVLLACDSTNRPIKVIKLGLDAAGRAATKCEADLLEKLPPNTIGCTRVTGRLDTPEICAFATDYFPGESPEDDRGMEVLFHSWVSTGPFTAVEKFDAWRELENELPDAAVAEWKVLRDALAGKSFRSTLFHGDFAPWNIRAVNLQNLQAFDWERGSLHGIPGWDWLHFVVQTSILARRHTAERVAAEIEELLQSPRFQNYARATGIRDIVRPLTLAYLLHHRWIIQPLEGAQETEELFRLLAHHWGLAADTKEELVQQPSATSAPLSAAAMNQLWLDARRQLKMAASQLANVFWEPTLTAPDRPTLPAYLKSRWATILFCCAWLAAVAAIHYFYAGRITMLPLYALPCLVSSWKMDRRWGTVFAAFGAAIGPVLFAIQEPDFRHPDLICWNTLMRFITLQMCVFLGDRIRRQEDVLDHLTSSRYRRPDFGRHWAIVLASAAWFFLIAWGDISTGPKVSFLPLYLFPAILITLFLNLRWGSFVALLGAVVASMDEYKSNFNASLIEVFCWNLPMRFLMLYIVILLLDRLREESVLFVPRNKRGDMLNGQRMGC